MGNAECRIQENGRWERWKRFIHRLTQIEEERRAGKMANGRDSEGGGGVE
jgi:hypothetical protein